MKTKPKFKIIRGVKCRDLKVGKIIRKGDRFLDGTRCDLSVQDESCVLLFKKASAVFHPYGFTFKADDDAKAVYISYRQLKGINKRLESFQPCSASGKK